MPLPEPVFVADDDHDALAELAAGVAAAAYALIAAWLADVDDADIAAAIRLLAAFSIGTDVDVPTDEMRDAIDEIDARQLERLRASLEAVDVDTEALPDEPVAAVAGIGDLYVASAMQIPDRAVDDASVELGRELARQEDPGDPERLFLGVPAVLALALARTARTADVAAQVAASSVFGAASQDRQQALGFNEYIWATRVDAQVRPSHAENEGRRFRWDFAPAGTGHPGEDYNCRCAAIPDTESSEDRMSIPGMIYRYAPAVSPRDAPPNGARVAHVRTLPVSLELRQSGDGYGIVGYGLKWGVIADLYWFTESFEKGAFSHTLDDVRLLANHEGLPMARSPGTMQVTEDDVGLRIEATLDMRNPQSAEVASAVGRGDLDKMSIAFTMNYDDDEVSYSELPDGRTHYIIKKVDRLWEVSAVPWPAHESSELTPRDAPASLTGAGESATMAGASHRLRLLELST